MSGLKRQHTLRGEAVLSGRGLFTGFEVTARFKPAAPDTGVVFVRADQPEPVRIPALIDHVTKRARRSSLRDGAVSVETVEHCLAAIRGADLDNVEVELDNLELPGLDGSSMPFVEALTAAGTVEQDAPRRIVRVPVCVRVSDATAELVAWPTEEDKLEIIYELDHGADSPLAPQMITLAIDSLTFRESVAPARTFVFEEEAHQFQAAGLGIHLSYEDILVIGRDGPIGNKFRFPDECVRHKVLDLVGDLMLVGGFVCGKVYAKRSGHGLNHRLARAILDAQQRDQMRTRLSAAAKLDIRAIQRLLPHRYPMLLVDRVLEIDDDRRAVGVKNVTINEPFFNGHYPRQPIMPGVLILEAMAQLGGILVAQKLEHTGKVAVLLSIDRAKFRKPVVPGDQLVLEAESVRVKSRTGQVFCRARTVDELCAEASIRFMLVDADPV